MCFVLLCHLNIQFETRFWEVALRNSLVMNIVIDQNIPLCFWSLLDSSWACETKLTNSMRSSMWCHLHLYFSLYLPYPIHISWLWIMLAIWCPSTIGTAGVVFFGWLVSWITMGLAVLMVDTSHVFNWELCRRVSLLRAFTPTICHSCLNILRKHRLPPKSHLG